MRTKKEVVDFLESLVGGGVKCKGDSSLDSQCVTLIKVLMEFVGAPDPYKKRGHAKTVISAYLNEGIATAGIGFLSVFSNKNMGGGYGHIWLNAGDGDGTYYESNGVKPLIVTKGKTYSYDMVCNFDKYIKEGADMDALQECLAQHKKLVDEAREKDEALAKEKKDHELTIKQLLSLNGIHAKCLDEKLRLETEINELAVELKECEQNKPGTTPPEKFELHGKTYIINGAKWVNGNIEANYRIE